MCGVVECVFAQLNEVGGGEVRRTGSGLTAGKIARRPHLSRRVRCGSRGGTVRTVAGQESNIVPVELAGTSSVSPVAHTHAPATDLGTNSLIERGGVWSVGTRSALAACASSVFVVHHRDEHIERAAR
jgi:hypothetical protein